MTHAALRERLMFKLADGRLPLNSIPRVWGGPGNGETCHACEKIITKHEFVMEGASLAGGKAPLQLTSDAFGCGKGNAARSWRPQGRRVPPPSSALRRSAPRQTYREGSDLETAERVLTRDGSMSEALYWQFVGQYLSALVSSSSS